MKSFDPNSPKGPLAGAFDTDNREADALARAEIAENAIKALTSELDRLRAENAAMREAAQRYLDANKALDDLSPSLLDQGLALLAAKQADAERALEQALTTQTEGDA